MNQMTEIDQFNRKGWVLLLSILGYLAVVSLGIIVVPIVYLTHFLVAAGLGIGLILWGIIDLFVMDYAYQKKSPKD